jgi:ATP-dependent DNA helicase RecG
MTNDEWQTLVDGLRARTAEASWFEFKVNNATEPDTIGDYISALANSAVLAGETKGYLVWGIDDTAHAVVGTSFDPDAAKKGNEVLENFLARGLDPSTHFRFHRYVHDGKPMVVLEVERATQRPVAFYGREKIRIGSAIQDLRRHPDREASLWAQVRAMPFEDLLAEEHLTSIEVFDRLDVQSFFARQKKPAPETQDGMLQALTSARFLRSEHGGTWAITNLGALAIANDLNAFDRLTRKSLRIVAYDGNDRTSSARETLWVRGYASGWDDLIQLLRAILPSREEIVKGTNVERSAYPEIAVRELVANALVHQDLFVTGSSPIILIFKDRLEITNPGQPLVAPERFIDAEPRSRNERLARFMRLAKICEERGSGVDKAVSAAEDREMPAPQFQASGDSTRVTLLTARPYRDMTRDEAHNACYLHACLLYLRGEHMTNATLRRRLGLEAGEVYAVSRLIRSAVDAKLIRLYDPSAKRANARYVPAWA